MNDKTRNLNQVLLAAMDTYADGTCFQIKRGRHGRRYRNVSFREFRALAFRLTSYFRRQDASRVAIIADNCLEWMVAYVACLLSGGSVVPLRTSLAPDTLYAILRDAGADLVVVQRSEQTQSILTSLPTDAGSRLPDLRTILVAGDGEGLPPGAALMSAVLAEAPPSTSNEEQTIRSHAESVAPQVLASILYVTNKTDRPNGAVFDHAQSLAALRNTAEWFTFDQDDLAFTFRPWSEVPNLMMTLHFFLSGITNALARSEETVEEDMLHANPTVVLAAPHFFERTYDQIVEQVTQMPESSREVFGWAVAKGKEYRAAGSEASHDLRQEHARADLTFFSQMRGRIGGRLRRLYSTGASLPQEVADFFEAIGLPALNIYSLTEAGGFPAVSGPQSHRLGSCGRIAPGYQVRIASDGEVLVRGEAVMREYWRQTEETRQSFDADGWLRSGDVGYLDEDGYLYITGRMQHLMVLSTGHKIAPAAIENALTANPFIAQAAVFGEGKPYVSAVIVPDLETVSVHIPRDDDNKSEPIGSATHPEVKALLAKAIEEINRQLDRWEQIKAHTLIDPPLSQAADEQTPLPIATYRHIVAQQYAAQIEAMYPASVLFEEKAITQVQIDPERLRELLEKESILDAWLADAGIGFLFELAREKKIDAPSMVHICDAAAMVAQMENEEKPLSTALIVGDPIRIARALPPSRIQLLRHDHIRRMRHLLITMAKIVDGLVLGFAIDRYGYVRGVHKLTVALKERHHFLLGPQFRHHAAISRHCDAVVFFVPSGGRQVRVFADGQLVGRYANGDWSADNTSRVDEVVAQLTQHKQYDLNLIQRVLRCAFRMSEENLGAIFLLGDADVILERSDTSEIGSFAEFLSSDVEELSDEELINFAKQDGATVIDAQGQFRGCRILLRPGADTPAEIEPGKGARHSSAAKMSAESQCLAITVSQDGPITVYDGGKQVLSL